MKKIVINVVSVLLILGSFAMAILMAGFASWGQQSSDPFNRDEFFAWVFAIFVPLAVVTVNLILRKNLKPLHKALVVLGTFAIGILIVRFSYA